MTNPDREPVPGVPRVPETPSDLKKRKKDAEDAGEQRESFLKTLVGMVKETNTSRRLLGLSTKKTGTFAELRQEAGNLRFKRDEAERATSLTTATAAEKQAALSRRVEAEEQLSRASDEIKRIYEVAEKTPLLDDIRDEIRILERDAGKGIYLDTLIAARDSGVEEAPGIDESLKGLRQAYFEEEVGRLIKAASGEDISSQDKENQLKYVRAQLASLGVADVTEDDFKNNLEWVRLRSLVLNFHSDVQAEFRARVAISKFAADFRGLSAFDKATEQNSSVVASAIAQVLKIEEISKAVALLEKSSNIMPADLVDGRLVAGEVMREVADKEGKGWRKLVRAKLSDEQKDKIRERIHEGKRRQAGKELIQKENILFAQNSEDRGAIYEKMAKDLALEDGADPSDDRVVEKYSKIVSEAANLWFVMYRADEKTVNLKARGGLTHIGRLLHYGARAESKKFGPKETRAILSRPFLPAQRELREERTFGQRILGRAGEWVGNPDLGKDGWDTEEGRGMGVPSFNVFTFGMFGNEAVLQNMGFTQEMGIDGRANIIKTKDGNGRELPFMTFRYRSADGTITTVRYAAEYGGKDSHKKDKWKMGECIEVSKPTAEVMAKALEKAPEGVYQMYSGSLFPVEMTRKELAKADGVLNMPFGTVTDATEDDIFKRIFRAKGELFGNLDTLAKDGGVRKAGKYYKEDAWEALVEGAIKYGMSRDGRRNNKETWGIWRAKRANMILSAARRSEVITKEQEKRIAAATLGALPNRALRKVFGDRASEKPGLKAIMRTISAIDRSVGGGLDTYFGLLRSKEFRAFSFWAAIFGFIGEFWNGLSEGLPSAGGGGGGSKKRR